MLAEEHFLGNLGDCHRPNRVLELGCGLDTFAIDLAKIGIDVTALDIEGRFQRIKRGYEYLENFRFVQGDMTTLLGHPDGLYCGVVARQSLHMVDQGQRQDVVQRVGDVLHVGGVFWILDGEHAIRALEFTRSRWDPVLFVTTKTGLASCVVRRVDE